MVTLATVLVLLLAARLALPWVVKRKVDARLMRIPGYTGHVSDIGLHLWRGAYSLHGLGIYRKTGVLREPFFIAKDIDFSLAWRELLHGKVVSDIAIDHAQVIFVKGPTAETSQIDTDRRWQTVVKVLFPIDITRIELRDGMVRYIDTRKTPHLDVFMRNMHLVATGLRNRGGERGEEFPAHLFLDGDSLGGGKVKMNVVADPLASQPHFHLGVSVENVNLPDLNDSLRAIANVDVGRGTFRVVAEMAGRGGGFQGYVKPFFEDVDFRNIEDKNKGVTTRLWEEIVSGLVWLVKNRARDQVGTRIPFEGRFGDSKVGLLATVKNLFRHGFVRAFNPTVEGTVHADNVLPSGKSADGREVADVKSDASSKKTGNDDDRADAAAGRPLAPRSK